MDVAVLFVPEVLVVGERGGLVVRRGADLGDTLV
jgi:hypothetical protein